MKIKFLQLNMFKGIFSDRVIEFIKSEDIDIVNLQEVSGPPISFNNADCFKSIKESLGYNGELVLSWEIKNIDNGYFGNATLFKKSFNYDRKEILSLSAYRKFAMEDIGLIDDRFPRAALFLRFNVSGKKFWVINTHLIRGENPQDTPLKLEHGKKLYEQVKKIKEPFILSGDFNVTPDSQIISWFNSLARNLTVEYQITNTLNPRVHAAKHLFPEGLAVDYIFVENSLKVTNFRLVEKIDLSDHLGLLAQIQL